MEWIIQLPIVFFSIMFHEVSHGWTALRHGDSTAQRQGRLSFNPMVHIDPVGTLILPVFCLLAGLPPIGWAKPVPVNAGALRGGLSSMITVAAMGPLSNITLSLFAALAFKILIQLPALEPGYQTTIMQALIFAIQVNLFLAFFNLVPIHPLDGAKVVSGLLPWRMRRSYDQHQPYGFALILILVYFGAMQPLVSVPSRLTLNLMIRVGLLQ